jgi:NAD-dependent DNA ligase
MIDLNENEQPVNQHFNLRRNKEKAVYGLKGILLGITADQEIDQLELLFLDVWLKEQKYLRNDGDVIDLLDLVGDILSDGVITKDELEELTDLVNDIIKYKKIRRAGEESKVNEFIGLLTGVASDNEINNEEIYTLLEWLKCNPEVEDEWPVNIIAKQLLEILEDGVIDQDERDHLLEVVKNITGIRFEESGAAYGMATEFFEDDIAHLAHEDTAFCFTGTFVTGNRKTVQNTAQNKGAIIKSDVTSNVDYLVIGTLASRDWRFTSHGRKIEKALKLKDEGHSIVIINERTWLKHA